MFQDYSTYSDAEIQRWLQLRAIEWSAWTAYLSQPAVPVLLIVYPWPAVLIAVALSDFVWQIIQYSFVSVRLSELSCLLVVWLKWPAAVGSSIYLFVHGRYAVAILALLWPMLASVVASPIGILFSLLRIRRSLGSISLALAKKIGHLGQEVSL
jgi:hypothetical protein